MPPKKKSSRTSNVGSSSSHQPPRTRQRTQIAAQPSNDPKKMIFKGKRLVRSHLVESPVLSWLNKQNCLHFLEFQHNIYAEEVVMFYKSLKEHDGNLVGIVHDRRIELSPGYISELFGLDNEGLSYWHDPKSWSHEHYDIKECISKLTQESSIRYLDFNIMPPVPIFGPNTYILFVLVMRNLMGRERNDAKIDYMTGFVMWKIMSQVKLNLPFFIIRHMYAMRNKKVLPYGQLLSYIFDLRRIPHANAHIMETDTRNYFFTLSDLWQANVYLHDNKFIDIRQLEVMPVSVQKRIKDNMKYQNEIRVVPGLKGRPPNVDENEEEDFDMFVDPPSPQAYTPSPSMQDIMNYLQTDVMGYMQTQFEGIHTHLASIDGHVAALDDRVGKIEDRLDAWDPFRSGQGHDGASGSGS